MKVLLDSCIWPGVKEELARAGILRLVDVRHDRQGPLCIELLARYGAELAGGAIVTAEPSRVRVRTSS